MKREQRAKCPRCQQPLRIRPGTTRKTPGQLLRLQCAACLKTHPEDYEWTPAMVSLLNQKDDE